MHVLLGYLLCLVVVTPAISIDVFFALIGVCAVPICVFPIMRARKQIRARSKALQAQTGELNAPYWLVIMNVSSASKVSASFLVAK